MRAAIYARYSSELQSDRSIEDQVALCRQYAARNGLIVAAVYEDRAQSGASMVERRGVHGLMAAARAGDIEVVVVESLDRLSRDFEDLAGVWKRLTFLGIAILGVHDGRADALQIGVRGLVGALYLQDLSAKVRRGMAGVVRDGRHAGGRAYGYRPVPGQAGELAIDESEAAVVRRIAAEYLAGAAPREIAGGLNRDLVPPPRGRAWNASTIGGSASRGTGILRNPLYAGRIVWNRLRMVKNPDTGRRVSRVNAAAEQQVADAPQLAIFDPTEWERLRAHLARRAGPGGARLRKPRHLLSGALRCGVCGSGMGVHDRDKTGKRRIHCSRHRESGTCSHGRYYYLEAVEHLVIDGLRESLAEPRRIAIYVEEYQAERRRLARDAGAHKAALERRLATVRADLERLVDALASGLAGAASVRERIMTLETERGEIEAAIARADEPSDVVAIQPAAVRRYLAAVENLRDSLAGGIDAGAPDATAFRDIVSEVAVFPVPPRQPLHIEAKGRISALIGRRPGPDSGLQVVAGERFKLPPTIEAATFPIRVGSRD